MFKVMAIQNQWLSLLEQTNHHPPPPQFWPNALLTAMPAPGAKARPAGPHPQDKTKEGPASAGTCPALPGPSAYTTTSRGCHGLLRGGNRRAACTTVLCQWRPRHHLLTPPAAQVQALETVARPRRSTLRGAGWGSGTRPAGPEQKSRSVQSCRC